MSARDNILGRLRQAPRTTAALPDVGAWYARTRRQEGAAERCERLRQNLLAAHAEVIDSSATRWPAQLAAIASAKGVRSLLLGQGRYSAAEEAVLRDQLLLLNYEHAIESWKDVLFESVDAGLTWARSAIAETGSLILWPDADEPRTMSLVPPLHFVLLDVRQVHADLHAAMEAEQWAAGMPTNALLVSGPSKTSDIQQTLAYGAHGPRELVVMLLHPEAAV